MKNCRIFVEKKAGFDLEAKRLEEELRENFSLEGLQRLRLLNCYDIFAAGDLELAKKRIFSEVVTDVLLEDFPRDFPHFAVEYLAGQFDQRADSAYQCLQLLSSDMEEVKIRTGKILLFEGSVEASTVEKIKNYYINPVEMREKDLTKLSWEEASFESTVPVIPSFAGLRESMGLAMSQGDLDFIEEYFQEEEGRMPTETEIRVLDTYWSDHCRHTTFETILEKIVFPKSSFGEELQRVYEKYLKDIPNLTLMEMAKCIAKKLRKEGRLEDLEVSEEVNACSVYIDMEVDGKLEKWLLMFKNETHNHPTEIEPFGGASTCLGGAIRDPLSGRAYVYQAIRVSGAGSPLKELSETLPGKLPQRKICKEAARGYSSYGNQIGLCTGLVSEIYHPGYEAKRMEVGAVVAAAPAKNVRREHPEPGDVVLLLGGKTGRDGCGGATGSSKAHDAESLESCGAEVQKGNAPEERKIQRLFRKGHVARMIKKCNDFGAGGVSVAIGELADGLIINLDDVPTKYAGLNGTELAISESQERMAVLLDAKDVEAFLEEARKENLEAKKVAVVTQEKRLVLLWKGQKIVDLSRAFLDTNGLEQRASVEVREPEGLNPMKSRSWKTWKDCLSDLNVATQKGLVELFDASIGAGTVFMPFGGSYQKTPMDVAVQKIALEEGETTTASAIAWGFDPELSSYSPYHGAAYAVLSSLAKLVAVGVDYRKVRLSFQEYFQKLGEDPKNWGQVFAALLGTLEAQEAFGTPAIGGKDSMSGSFQDIHVPPTLISFAVGTVDTKAVVSPEFKEVGSHIYLLPLEAKENALPDYEKAKEHFATLHSWIQEGKVLAVKTLGYGGLVEALCKMSFGNRIGFALKEGFEASYLPAYGSFVIETKEAFEHPALLEIGRTEAKYAKMAEIEAASAAVFEPIYPSQFDYEEEVYELPTTEGPKEWHSKKKIAEPRALILCFPGTNSEYDSARAFQKAGAKVQTLVFRNQNREEILASLEEMEEEIRKSNIIMIPGGFSAGDEPDGSGKFIAVVLQNPKIQAAIEAFLAEDGLLLGICNGFQALVKSGLLPYGRFGVEESSPTLTFNRNGRHVSQMVRTKILSTASPWLAGFDVGEEHVIPVSHGEGRFYVGEEEMKKLVENGQIVSQYVDLSGAASSAFPACPNGASYAIEGLVSADGKIFGKMGHSERKGKDLYQNIPGPKEQDIFKNAVNYFK